MQRTQKKYIDKLGYFANGLNGFADINYFAPYSLDNVQVGIDKPFFYREKNFALFLPEDKVKEVKKEKKWRPFVSYEEFRLYFAIGDVIRIITIEEGEKLEWQTVMYIGVTKNINGTFIQLGANSYSLQYLFSHFKYARTQDGSNVDEEWQPFGVEVEE